MHIRKSSANGFTLIEIMVAVLLLLVVAAAFVPVFLSGLGHASASRTRSVATNLARQRMEQVRQLDYREIDSPSTLAARFGTSETVRGETFNISYAVDPYEYEPEHYLKKVTITVSWTAPPPVSPAVITSMIHQQFLGPRGSQLEFNPLGSDPLHTPFPVLGEVSTNPTATKYVTMRYHIAEVDWSLVYDNLTDPGRTPKDVYMRLLAADDSGACTPIGPSDQDFKLDKTHLHCAVDADGNVTDIWFEYSFDVNQLPDGYWEMRAIAYNEYDEPGNVWRLRVRTEKGPPATPGSFAVIGQPDNESFVLTWTAGPERDRDHYALERRRKDLEHDSWLDWTRLQNALDPNALTYTDRGDTDADPPVDPWGSDLLHNYYQYRLWAVDTIGNEGGAAVGDGELPAPPTTATTYPFPTSSSDDTTSSSTSSTTVTTLPTTTTTLLYSVDIKNTSKSSHTIKISGTDLSGELVEKTLTIAPKSTDTVSDLPPGNYNIYLDGSSTAVYTFQLPRDAGQQVYHIN